MSFTNIPVSCFLHLFVTPLGWAILLVNLASLVILAARCQSRHFPSTDEVVRYFRSHYL